ncbi:MAG TPA: DUF1351 domain-containing protein [Candidatus Mediterraneibacter ornithocaccae]|nr:DUF1351 domain-containing protein [Candidatus Mediterraneibacter ornithocaccae]
MQEYKSLAFTEETIKEAKADRAKLNKLRTAFEDERKRIKKLCMAPYDEFEKQVKELIALIDEPIRLIDSQIKEVEEQRRVEKKGKVLEFYESTIGSLRGVLPFEKVFRPEYLNATKSMKSITQEIQALIDRVNSDLDTIEGFGSKYELQIKDAYLKTLDLSTAMQEKARLEEVERRLAERRQEEQRRAEENAAREAAEAQRKLQMEQAVDTRNAQPEVQAEKSEGEKETTQQTEKQEPQLFRMDFRVWGTKEQLMGLRQYLINNNIKFGKVE